MYSFLPFLNFHRLANLWRKLKNISWSLKINHSEEPSFVKNCCKVPQFNVNTRTSKPWRRSWLNVSKISTSLKSWLLLYCTRDVPLYFQSWPSRSNKEQNVTAVINSATTDFWKERNKNRSWLLSYRSCFVLCLMLLYKALLYYNQCGRSTPVKSRLWLVWCFPSSDETSDVSVLSCYPGVDSK